MWSSNWFYLVHEIIATAVNFVLMTVDFISFVKSFRNSDAPGIEYGYKKHSFVLEALNQNKYVEIYFTQMETLLCDHSFRCLQEARLNRCVRRYHGKTGKPAAAVDENLEHWNGFYSMFSKVRTQLAFCTQGNWIGLAMMCKRLALQ